MAINRRGILRGIPAMPFAARAMKGEINKQIGQSNDFYPQAQPTPTQAGIGSSSYTMDKMRLLLKHKAVLDELREQIRADTGTPSYIDPDIACKCWSYNVKVQHQRERNIERQVQSWVDDEQYKRKVGNVYDLLRSWAEKYFIHGGGS